MKTLRELYAEHHGKLSDKWSIYLDAYEHAFRPWRGQPVRLLEIGVQNGGSMEIWPRYFPEGRVFIGCDIDPLCGQLRYDDPRVHLIVGDANQDAMQESIVGINREFDIVIDDGSHTSSDIVRSFARYFGHVVEGGLFVVEDLHCGYWGWREGGLHHPFSSMAFFKLLVDILNHEHWGIPATRGELVAGFTATYGVAIPEDVLAQVHSITFVNSLCIIRKAAAASNVLGERIFAGEQDLVVPDLRRRPEVLGMRAEETGNPYSHPVTPPAERLPSLQHELDRSQAEVAALRDQHAHEVAALRDQHAHEVAALRDQSVHEVAALRGQLVHDLARLREARARADALERRAERAEQLALERLMQLQAVLGSTSWRMVSKLHPVLNRLKGVKPVGATTAPVTTVEASRAQTYQNWLAYEAEHSQEDAKQAEAQ
jgi:hypothetical protein